MNETETDAAVHTLALLGIQEPVLTKDMALELIESYISKLLLHDFNTLFSMLYRIDVREDEAKACFGRDNKQIAGCLAQLVWKRQLQKAESRRLYRQKHD